MPAKASKTRKGSKLKRKISRGILLTDSFEDSVIAKIDKCGESGVESAGKWLNTKLHKDVHER